jgi:NADH:ubiquinone oxidoreductase subunit F (NADH-binding)
MKPDIESFYHLTRGLAAEQSCSGLACYVARADGSDRWWESSERSARVYCLGKCYRAPARASDTDRPPVRIHTREAVVARHLGDNATPALETYRARGGYRALDLALRRTPEETIRAVEASELRGRGGAAYPTGRKWRAVFQQTAREKYVVANADEGDPGAYIDRFILEDNPHGLIEALAIAGYAVGARQGYIYLRAEYPDAARRLATAIEEARQARLLGAPLLGTGFSFDLHVEVGRGSYVCGEETALLNAIEGRRPEVRVRPPYPAESGLFGRPTLVNNVETLATIPWIVEHGADAYRRLGFSTSRGTKVLSLNSLFRRPGLYEVELGIPVRQVVDELGGGLKSGQLKGVIIGGPLAGVIPPSLLDTPLAFEELRAIGASVGHGGVVAFDERTSIGALVHHVFELGAFESCGKCTPCRLGARRIEGIFRRITTGAPASMADDDEWQQLIRTLAATSLCGHGSGLAEFAASIVRHYPTELRACFASS